MTESIATDLTRMRDMMEFNDKTAKWKQKTDGSIQSDLVKSLKLVLLEGMKDTVGKNFFRDVIDHIRGLLFEPDEPKQFYAYILGNNDSNKSLGKDILIKYEDHIDISSGSSSSSGTSASSDSSIEDDGEGEPLADGPVTRSKSQSLPQAGRKDSYFIPEETVTKVADVVCITPLWSPDVQHCKMVIEIKSTTIMNYHETELKNAMFGFLETGQKMILGLLIGVQDYYLYKLELKTKSEIAMMQTYSGSLNEDELVQSKISISF